MFGVCDEMNYSKNSIHMLGALGHDKEITKKIQMNYAIFVILVKNK